MRADCNCEAGLRERVSRKVENAWVSKVVLPGAKMVKVLQLSNSSL